MEISLHTHGAHTAGLAPIGDLDADGARLLADHIEKLIRARRPHLVLALTSTHNITPDGVNAIARINQTRHQYDGSLRLVIPARHPANDAIRAARLHESIPVGQSIPDALAAAEAAGSDGATP